MYQNKKTKTLKNELEKINLFDFTQEKEEKTKYKIASIQKEIKKRLEENIYK